MTRPSEARAVQHQQMVLRETLALAVPMHMVELRTRTAEDVTAIAAAAASVVGARGDALQFGGKHCQEAFTALARGLACGALLAAGGIDFLDLHWCADPSCRAASRFDHTGNTP